MTVELPYNSGKDIRKHSRGVETRAMDTLFLVLNYCYLSLKKLVAKPSSQESEDGATNVKETQFRFTDLHVDSDSDEEEKDRSDNNEDATTKRLERPTGPDEEFTIEDLIDSTDRFKACIFLSEVENVMGMVSGTYETTKANMVACKKDATFFMGCLVTTGVVTNFAIHEVMLLEAELKVECPHLDTFYRIIACVFLTDKIDDLSSLIKGYGKSVSRSELIAFIGDAVEQVFRYPSSASHYITPLVELFCKKWRLPLDEVTNLIKVVQLHVCSESFPTFLLDDELVETFKSLGLTLHFWMNDIPNIGGGQSIINTQSLLQMLASRLMTGGVRKLHVPETFYGDLWDEEKLLARDIRGDMDQLLMADILPELLFSCQYGALSKPEDEYNARFKELLPLFVLLADFVSNPAKPVPLSLTFGIHAILTSIFKLQGNNDVDAIANFSKETYDNYFVQLKAEFKTKLSSSEIWRDLVATTLTSKDLPAIFLTPVNDRGLKRAFRNPCCAGMFLEYLTYFINLEVGACLIDFFQQLRLVLHLHNALRVRNLLNDDIPLLTPLDNYFQNVPSIWQGGKPERNNIITKFLIINGRPLEAIRHLHEEARRFALDQPLIPRKNFNLARIQNSKRRHRLSCTPDGFLPIFRNVSLGVFSGTQDRNSNSRMTDATDNICHSNFVRRAQDAIDKIDKEMEMFGWNLPAIAGICDRFLRDLVEKMNWRPLLNRVIASKPKCATVACPLQKERVALCEVIHLFLLSPCEFIDDIENHQTVISARDCLEEHFYKLKPSDFEFFPTG